MSFEAEWATAKSVAMREQQTRINHVPTDTHPSGGGGKDGLSMSPKRKKAAANYIDEHLLPDLKDTAELADEENATSNAVKEFTDWETSRGITHVRERWKTTLQNLSNRIGSECTGLRGTGTLSTDTDIGTHNAFSRIDLYGPRPPTT